MCPRETFINLVTIPVRFVTFDGVIAQGVIEMHRDLIEDVEDLFRFMIAEQFPLSSVIPIAQFGWNDERSMAANNTSGFHYRFIAGTERLSKHAYGRAIDINPLFNPCVEGMVIQPAGAVYDPCNCGVLTADSPVTEFLKAHGWTWGGDWESPKDYQHFQKPE